MCAGVTVIPIPKPILKFCSLKLWVWKSTADELNSAYAVLMVLM